MSEVNLTTNNVYASRAFLGIGQPIDLSYTSEGSIDFKNILKQANLDWTVSKRPIVTTAAPLSTKPFDQDFLDVNGTAKIQTLWHKIEDYFARPDEDIKNDILRLMVETENSYLPNPNNFSIVRDDINYPFGVLGNIYKCINNEDCVRIVEPLLNDNKAVIYRAGSFNFGANCWVIVKLPNRMMVGTEYIDQFIKISWSHNGTERLSATFIANLASVNAQINPPIEGEIVGIDIRHTTNAKDRMNLVTQLLVKGEGYFGKLEEILTEFINTPFSSDDMTDYINYILPISVDDSDLKRTRAENNQDEINDLFKGIDSSIEYTKYAAYSAVVQWCDYNKPTRVTEYVCADDEETARNEAKMQSLWSKSGSARKMKDDAFKYLR